MARSKVTPIRKPRAKKGAAAEPEEPSGTAQPAESGQSILDGMPPPVPQRAPVDVELVAARLTVDARVLNVTSKTKKGGSDYAATINFRLETDYAPNLFACADLVVREGAVVVSIGDKLAFDATARKATAVTRERKVPGSDGETSISHELMMSIAFSLHFNAGLYKHIGLFKGGDPVDVFIRPKQIEMEGAGAQDAAGA